MGDDKIIERGKPSLNFIEQLQNQIQLCREAMSDNRIALTPRVEALESLLWAKLKDDTEYTDKMKELNLQFLSKRENIQGSNEFHKDTIIWTYKRNRAKQQFKAIMIFIDKKGLMPIGDEDA